MAAMFTAFPPGFEHLAPVRKFSPSWGLDEFDWENFGDRGEEDEVDRLRRENEELKREREQRQLDDEMRRINGSDDRHIGPP